jgi:uncharacterized protein (TIGR03067 family)
MEGDRKAGAGVIRLDQAANPISFSFTATEDPEKGEIVLGIYRIEADRLTMCLGDERPPSFVGAGNATLVELVRSA